MPRYVEEFLGISSDEFVSAGSAEGFSAEGFTVAAATAVAKPRKVVFDDATYAFYEIKDNPETAAPGAAIPAVLAVPAARTVKIVLRTTQRAPGNIITLRNEVDGWRRDIFGRYSSGESVFTLDSGHYPGGFQFKFLLNDAGWMLGGNGFIDTTITEHVFTDDAGADPGLPLILFPAHTPRFRHGLENLTVYDSLFQQERFLGNRNEDVPYDIIVIGSGMGGGIVADRTSDLGLNTLVLDVGTLHATTHVSNVYADWDEIVKEQEVGHYETIEGSKFLFGAQMALGGRSLYWSGIILRMQDWELARFSRSIGTYLSDSGGKGYEQAEKLIRKRRTLGSFQEQVVSHLKQQMPDLAVVDLPRSRHQPNLDQNNNLESVLFSSTGIFSSADLLSDSKAFVNAVGFDTLTVNLGHLVTQIVPDPADHTRVRDVICQDLIGGAQRTYKGRAVVLAAGSIESPKIVLQSGLNEPSGKAGVGLTDHPYLFSKAYLLPRGNPFFGHRNHAKVLLSAGDAAENHFAFYCELLVNPWYWHVRRADDDLWNEVPPNEQVTIVSMKFGFGNNLVENNRVFAPGIGKRAQVRVDNMTLPGPAFEHARQFRNRVLDAIGMPLSQADRDEGMGLAAHGGTVNHAGGTLRMGAVGQGVVDENLRFHAYQNLYCCDPSIYPYIPTANPSLTLGALGIRLADHLRAIL